MAFFVVLTDNLSKRWPVVKNREIAYNQRIKLYWNPLLGLRIQIFVLFLSSSVTEGLNKTLLAYNKNCTRQLVELIDYNLHNFLWSYREVLTNKAKICVHVCIDEPLWQVSAFYLKLSHTKIYKYPVMWTFQKKKSIASLIDVNK